MVVKGTTASLVRISRRLAKQVDALSFSPPVTHVYNPLIYARRAHEKYLQLVSDKPVEAMFVGMNPGPWGMAQTGVPFGEVTMTRDWLKLSAKVDRPMNEHPKRPVSGFDCKRSEVSGRRIWSLIRDAFETPEAFFARFFVGNYCPLAFLEESGRNRTPDKLPASERDPLFAVCDRALRDMVLTLKPRFVIGVGVFAEGRARLVCDGLDVTVGRILHPSPASPAANRDWAGEAGRQIRDMGLDWPG